MNLTKAYALSLLGLPYRWGGDDPIGGFDCSGLVIEILQSCGVLPRGYDNTAQGLFKKFWEYGEPGVVEFGSLAFFGRSVEKIIHITYLLDDYRMIEAGGGGSRTTSNDAAERDNAFVRIRPIKWRSDLVAIVKPKYPWDLEE